MRATIFVAVVAALLTAGARAEDNGADWPSYAGTAEDHYSPLRQIDDQNVARLGLAWSYDIDTTPNAYSAPIAVDGILYFGAGYSVIHAIDARTGKLLWKYDPEAPKAAGQKMRAAWGIRGIAFADGRIFTGTIDGRLIALDAKSGKLLWSAMTVEADDPRYIAGPPRVFDGKVVIGHGGGDFAPVRGYVTAYDAATGKQLWRFYTVPGDPAKGFENDAMAMAASSWTGEWWKFGGGGTVWNAIAYDPKFNRLYFGTGNGAPWNRKIRSPGGGDNLFICSIVALDADTGKYVWHYQLSPGDVWDFDADLDIELADLTVGGKKRSVILQAAKNGFFYVIDRADGKLLWAEKFARADWAERIDLETGRPVENPAARFADGKPVALFPSPTGAHGIDAMSFSPVTGLAYIPVNEQGRIYADPPGDLKKWRYPAGEMITTGVDTKPLPDAHSASALIAWDPVKQQPVWRVPLTAIRNGGTAATAGNLVFQGRTDGDLVAYAADTGKRLWSFGAQTAVMAQPITYLAGGRQFVTVIAGSRNVSATGLKTEWNYYTQKWRVLTFALDGTAKLPPEDKRDLALMDDPQFAIDPTKVAIGKTVFAQRCANCHGAAAISGGAAPDLRKAAGPMSFETLVEVVRNGALRERGMPRFEELTDPELEGLQHYVRQRAREGLTG